MPVAATPLSVLRQSIWIPMIIFELARDRERRSRHIAFSVEDALTVRNKEKGGAVYPLEPREPLFRDLGVHVRAQWFFLPCVDAPSHRRFGRE